MLPPDRRACPDRGLAAQGTVTVLTALPARRRPSVPEPSGDERPCPACRNPNQPASATPAPKERRPGGGHPQGHPRRRRAHRHRRGAGQRNVPDHRGRLSAVVGLGARLRRGRRGRGGSAPAPTARRWPATCAQQVSQSSRSTARTRPPAAGAARPTPSMPKPPPARYSTAGPPPPPRPATGRWRWLRMFKLAKASAVKSRTQAINQLKSILVSEPPRRVRRLRWLRLQPVVGLGVDRSRSARTRPVAGRSRRCEAGGGCASRPIPERRVRPGRGPSTDLRAGSPRS